MGSIEAKIREKLIKDFMPVVLELENESHKHNFSRGPDGHFKLLIVSERFTGLSAVERHQKIFASLKSEMAEGVHALAIKALTPNEATLKGVEFQTPACQHTKH